MAGWRRKRRVMRDYDATAEIYDALYANEQKAKYEAAFETLGKENFGLTIDVGTGTGLLFNYVAPHSTAVIGVDISRKSLLQAIIRAARFSNVYLVLADADHLPLRNGSCDTVFAVTLVQNSPNPVETVRELKRVAKPTSTFVVTGLAKVFTLRSFKKILHDSGLNIVALRHENLQCYVAVCTDVFH